MKQFTNCFKRSDTDVIVAKLSVLTTNECVASPNPTQVTHYYFVRICGLLGYCYRPSIVVCLLVYQSVTVVSRTKRLKWSSCRLGSGLRWAEGTTHYMGSISPMRRGNFEGETGEPLYSKGSHCGHLCKHGWTDRGAVWVVGSYGPKASCVRWVSRSPMGRGNSGG